MKSWNQYTDKDRKEFAEAEYGSFNTGDAYTIGKGKDKRTAGYVQERFGFNKNGSPNADYNGAQAYVVTPQNHQNPKNVKEVAVVYQGSDTQFKSFGEACDTTADWGGNDGPMAFEIGGDGEGLPPQFQSSSQILNSTMKKYPNAKFRVYGHSLGCMDLQAAVAGCKYPQRIEAAYGYEGPNIYEKLPLKQQVQVNEMKNKINLYADEEDMVAVGYANHEHMGNLYAVHSSNKYPEAKSSIWKTFGVAGNFIVHEHMFGGYQFDKNGKLNATKVNRTSDGWLDDADTVLAAQPIAHDLKPSLGLVGAEVVALVVAAIDVEYDHVKAIASKAISTVQEEGGILNALITAKKELLEKNYTTMKKMARSIGTDLSSGEIESALSEVSATKSNMVTKPEAKFEKSAKEMKSLISKMESYGAKLSSGAESYVSTDNATASDIGSITSPTALFN